MRGSALGRQCEEWKALDNMKGGKRGAISLQVARARPGRPLQLPMNPQPAGPTKVVEDPATVPDGDWLCGRKVPHWWWAMMGPGQVCLKEGRLGTTPLPEHQDHLHMAGNVLDVRRNPPAPRDMPRVRAGLHLADCAAPESDRAASGSRAIEGVKIIS